MLEIGKQGVIARENVVKEAETGNIKRILSLNMAMRHCVHQ
jgi:hypothetical protein